MIGAGGGPVEALVVWNIRDVSANIDMCSRVDGVGKNLLFWAKFSSSLVDHLPKVWDTCSKLAQGVGADYLRCDVFVTGGKVDVNEISLSSYWGNTLSDRVAAALRGPVDRRLPAGRRRGRRGVQGGVLRGDPVSPTHAV